MDSETVHGTVRSGVTRVPEAGPLFWKRQKHGEKGLNTATGAAGEGCNEKAAFITPGIQKAE